jgi:hypothetical protein
LGRIDLSELARQIERDIDPNDEKELILEKIQFIMNEWEQIDIYIREKYFK